MEREEQTTHVSLLRLLMAGLTGVGVDGRAVARRAGLPAGALAGHSDRVPVGYLHRLWRVSLEETSDPYLGIKAAGHWRFGMLQLTDYLFAAAPTLGEAVADTVRYLAQANTAANEVRLTGHPDEAATITYQVRSGDPEVDAVASQFALGAMLSLARHAIGREVRPLHLGLTSAPPRPGDLARPFGARQVDFGTGACTMTLAAADLARPLPGADPALAAALRGHAASVIAAQTAAATWTDLLRLDLAAHLADDDLSLAAAARRLTVSPRSLQRRLGEEGTSWREVVDGVRRERAALLLGRGLGKTAVAARLGFSDARALRGVLHRWETGPAD
jgi:AraC-like DNA-binding protein